MNYQWRKIKKMENNLRNFAEKVYQVSENADTHLDAIEELEEVLRLIPIIIKEGVTNTKVNITKEGVVIEPNTDVKSKTPFIIKEESVINR